MAYPPIGIARLMPDEGGVAVEIAVPDVASTMDYGFTKIQWQSATSAAGSFSDVVASNLVAGKTYYDIEDTAGTVTTWYRYRFESTDGTSDLSAFSPVFTVAPTGQTFGTIRQELAREMGMFDSGTTTAAGSTSTVVDSGKINSVATTNKWQGGFVKMTSGDASGQVAQIASYAIASGTFTVTPVFSAASGSAKTYELYRDLSPTDLDEAINDALQLLPIEDEHIFAGDNDTTTQPNRKEYPLPFWVRNRADIRGLEQMRGPGTDVVNERLAAQWEPVLEGTYEIRGVSQAFSIVFNHAIGANSVYRVRLLRPYITSFGERITADATVVNLPLHDVMVAARFQAYDRLVNAQPPNAKKSEWETRRNKAQAQFHSLMARYYPRSSRLQQPGKTVWVV